MRNNPSIRIRPATKKDLPVILAFIFDLAKFEQLEDECFATEEQLQRYLFGKEKVAEALIAEYEKQPAGFALYFYNFSTFLTKPGIWLEDLFVKEEFRGKGIGGSLLDFLARYAANNGYGRLEWAVLDWNIDAINFYESYGAVLMEDWRICRIADEELDSYRSE